MSIPVVKEDDPELLSLGIEECVFCGDETHHWYLPFNTPVCPLCADSREPNDIPKRCRAGDTNGNT